MGAFAFVHTYDDVSNVRCSELNPLNATVLAHPLPVCTATQYTHVMFVVVATISFHGTHLVQSLKHQHQPTMIPPTWLGVQFVAMEGYRKYGLVHSSQVSNYISFSKEDTDEDKKAELVGGWGQLVVSDGS